MTTDTAAPSAPRASSPTALIVLVVAVAACAALVHVYVHLQLIQVGYDLSRESRLGHDLGEQNQKLRLELAVRKDPSVIERRARQELHMEPPDPRLIRVLRLPPATAKIMSAKITETR
jgi:cell division protein FtsL